MDRNSLAVYIPQKCIYIYIYIYNVLTVLFSFRCRTYTYTYSEYMHDIACTYDFVSHEQETITLHLLGTWLL